MNEHLWKTMGGTPVYEQKKLRKQREAPEVRFANGVSELLHLTTYTSILYHSASDTSRNFE